MIDYVEVVTCFMCDETAYVDDCDEWLNKDDFWLCPQCKKRTNDFMTDTMLSQMEMGEDDHINYIMERMGIDPC